MGAGFTRDRRGWERRKEQVTASRLLWSTQARVPPSLSAGPPAQRGGGGCGLLTAGSCRHSAPGGSEHACPTLRNACSPLSGGHTPARTENPGSLATDPDEEGKGQIVALERPRGGGKYQRSMVVPGGVPNPPNPLAVPARQSLGCTYAPDWTWKEPTSLPSHPRAWREG